MRKFYTMMAVLALAISSVTAQTMTLKIEGQEVKNGDNVVINKAVKATPVGPMTMYDLEVDIEFTSLISQTFEVKAIDLDRVSPGIQCCPIGYTCSAADSNNDWVSSSPVINLTAEQEINGHWVHYGYNRTKPADGTVRKSIITFKGEKETIQFNLTIDTNPSAINNVTVDSNNGAAFNLAGQRVNAEAKGIVIRNGKKYLVK